MASSPGAGEAGTELCGQGLCSYDYAPLTHQTTARECEGSTPPTRTLSLKVEVPGAPVLGLPSQLCRNASGQLPKPFSNCYGQAASRNLSLGNKEVSPPGERDFDL